MNPHVNEWLSAYHDGELSGARLRQVETHLGVCSACLLELEEITKLSKLLNEVPVVERRLSPEQFTTQVRLRLPRKAAPLTWQKALTIGWRVIPAGLLCAWAFMQAGVAVGAGILLAVPGRWENIFLPVLVSFGTTFVITILLWAWLAGWWVTHHQSTIQAQ